MNKSTRILTILALLAATPFFANISSAQSIVPTARPPAVSASGNPQTPIAAVAAPASTYPASSTQSPDDLCVTNPSLPMHARIPHKQVVTLDHPSKRVALLKHARKKRPSLPMVASKICPVTPKVIPVTYVPPAAPQQSLCQSAVGMASTVTSDQVSGMLTQAGLRESVATADADELAAAAAKATRANPDAAPAILAYAVKNINPENKDELVEVTKAVYGAAPDKAAGMAYATVATNPSETILVTQALLTAAPESDGAAIRQCAIDANPDLANQIATAANIPPDSPFPPGTTNPPGTPENPPDNSPT